MQSLHILRNRIWTRRKVAPAVGRRCQRTEPLRQPSPFDAESSERSRSYSIQSGRTVSEISPQFRRHSGEQRAASNPGGPPGRTRARARSGSLAGVRPLAGDDMRAFGFSISAFYFCQHLAVSFARHSGTKLLMNAVKLPGLPPGLGVMAGLSTGGCCGQHRCVFRGVQSPPGKPVGSNGLRCSGAVLSAASLLRISTISIPCPARRRVLLAFPDSSGLWWATCPISKPPEPASNDDVLQLLRNCRSLPPAAVQCVRIRGQVRLPGRRVSR